MNKSIRAGISIGLALTTLAFITAAAQAAGNSNCQVIYGGGEVCERNIEFSLDKFVQKANKGGEYVENLNTNDPRFRADQDVVFKVVVKNVGQDTIENMTVTDTLPSYVTFVSGAGNFDKNSNKITFTLQNLAKNEQREFIIATKVVGENSLPTDKAINCVVNHVSAVESNGATAKDSSQFCIERAVVAKPTPQVFDKTPVKKIPETGAESFLALIGLVPAGIAGFALRKKSKLS